jgi:phospholipid/cholesterol/gamma-HCH transport system ATP-binding protein
MVRVEQLSKKLGGQPVVVDVSMEVPDGCCVCVLGKSGAGKTVLLKLVAGIMPPDSGRVYYDGLMLNYGPFADNRQIVLQTGFVFQGGALFDGMSVGDNVALPLRERDRLPEGEIRKRVQQVLCRVGLPDSSRLGVRELSGGMVRLVAIARALVTEPKYVFLDEPTSGLDPLLRERVLGIIQHLARTGRSVLLVTHDLEAVRQIADRIYIMKAGRVYPMDRNVKKEDYE